MIPLAVTSVSLDRRKLSARTPSSAITDEGVCLRDKNVRKEKAPAESWGARKLSEEEASEEASYHFDG